MNNSTIRLVTISLALLIASPRIIAAYPAGDGNFLFRVENHDVQLAYPHATRQTRMTNLTASWEQNLNSRLRGGLQLSYLDLSQAADRVFPATSSTGYGVGINLQALVIDRQWLEMALRAGYGYQNTEGGSTLNQNTEYRWHRLEGGVDVTLFPKASVALLAGASLISLDGEQRDSGVINRITNFSENDPLRYYGGLSIRTDPSGRIGLKWYGGYSQGFYLLFSRNY